MSLRLGGILTLTGLRLAVLSLALGFDRAGRFVLATGGAGVLDRGGGVFGFVGEGAFAFGDVLQLAGVLLQRIHAAAFVDDFLAFVEEAFQVHGGLLGLGLRH